MALQPRLWPPRAASEAPARDSPTDIVAVNGYALNEVTTPNLRQTARKILRCKALVRMENGKIVTGRTLDISVGGLCLVLENSLPEKLLCEVRLEFFLDGKCTRIQSKTRVVSCICTNHTYRVGLQFLVIDPKQVDIISRIL
ncbi:PilZ domain-containing protein [Janthinobacterium sp. CG_23.3]|uniref:PilZ domain-containing protein n=1 Tax=Janthinobacterium sp. CG_23.3 TaxID=3349634 RepID=UPI0038D451C1